MSSAHPYTAVDDDEDDTDICPVCDGQCTCRIQQLSMTELSIKYHQPTPPITSTTPIKKSGHPPKLARSPTSPNLKSPVPPYSQKDSAKIIKVSQNLKATSVAISKKVVKRRRGAFQSDEEAYSSSDIRFDSHVPDSDIQAEEENFIPADIYHKAYLRRQLLEGQLKKQHHNTDWVIRPRKKSGASDAEQMDVDTEDDAQSQNDEDENEPDRMEEDDDDTDGGHHYVGLATSWSEDEDESSFDADLFFANLLSDSDSTSSSSTSTRRRCHSYTLGSIDSAQLSSASESSPRSALESLPFEVTENWDGQLIFTNGLVGEAESKGIVDIHFETDPKRFIMADGDNDSRSSYPSSRHHDLSSTAQKSSDIDMFSISDANAGYEVDGGEAEEGDTTDEELVGDNCLPNERAMRLFNLPVPMSAVLAINPMSTVSSSIGVEKRRQWKIDGERKRGRRRLGAGTGPRAADILASKIVFGGDQSTGYASSSSASSDWMIKPSKGQQRASSTFHVNHSRQTQTPSTPRTGIFVPTGETRQAIIGEVTKGTGVPSPHPRFCGRRVAQYLLKKHLQQQSQSQSPAVPPLVTPTNTNGGSSSSIISDTPSPFHHLLSSAAASSLTGTEDLMSMNGGGDEYDTGSTTPCPCPTEFVVDETTCTVELDDVLEASFLEDSMDRECGAGVGSSSLTLTSGINSGLVEGSSATPTPATTTSSNDLVSSAAEASNKHLTRWDVISISAFKRTRERQQQAWEPPFAVADFGGVIKSGASAAESPLSALLWQNSGAGSPTGAESSKKTSSSIPPSTITPKTSSSRSKGNSNTKAAKRRLMMASATMSSPLVLPLSSASLSIPSSKCHSTSLTSHSHSQPHSKTTHKNRKELRQEKKLLKKKSTSSPSIHLQPSFFSTHPYTAQNNHHQFHTHQHHPNLKTRGTSGSQRMGFFGGAVPPLNL